MTDSWGLKVAVTVVDPPTLPPSLPRHPSPPPVRVLHARTNHTLSRAWQIRHLSLPRSLFDLPPRREEVVISPDGWKLPRRSLVISSCGYSEEHVSFSYFSCIWRLNMFYQPVHETQQQVYVVHSHYSLVLWLNCTPKAHSFCVFLWIRDHLLKPWRPRFFLCRPLTIQRATWNMWMEFV